MPKSQPPATPKISIIVPIYNVVPYLTAALDSILAQTYENLEIILVDDGSTDGSTEVAEAYAKRDSRIIYLRQTNSGVASARNLGLKLATGDFISFVDPDDTVAPTLIHHLYDSLTKHSADLSSTTFKSTATLTATLDTESALKQLFLEQNTTFHLWAKLYRRELWDGIAFSTGHIYEDVATQARIFTKCQKIHISHKPLYHYRRREGSFVTTPRPSQFADFFRFSEQNLALMQNLHPSVVPYAEKYIFTAARRTLQDLLRAKGSLSKTEREKYLALLKKHAPATLRLKQTPKTEKILAALAIANKSFPLPLLSLYARKSPAGDYS